MHSSRCICSLTRLLFWAQTLTLVPFAVVSMRCIFSNNICGFLDLVMIEIIKPFCIFVKFSSFASKELCVWKRPNFISFTELSSHFKMSNYISKSILFLVRKHGRHMIGLPNPLNQGPDVFLVMKSWDKYCWPGTWIVDILLRSYA